MTVQTLAGKAVLITGGSRGIGRATALRLARDGADVAISYVASADLAHDVVKGIEAHGVRGAAFQADQGDPEQVTGLVEAVVSLFGRLDVLVNNAGVFVTGAVDGEDTDIAALDRQYDINVRGLVTATRAASKVMTAGGRIISLSTASADRVPFPGIGDYSAGKAAVVAYTRAWARDLGPRGITANVVQTSSVNTEMNPDSAPFADIQRSRIPLGRFGRPEEMAGAIAFLAGPDAEFVNGAVLNVDGGFSA
jgi:3-oxoacyl-[acyl-carrier protein] reductase